MSSKLILFAIHDNCFCIPNVWSWAVSLAQAHYGNMVLQTYICRPRDMPNDTLKYVKEVIQACAKPSPALVWGLWLQSSLLKDWNGDILKLRLSTNQAESQML